MQRQIKFRAWAVDEPAHEIPVTEGNGYAKTSVPEPWERVKGALLGKPGWFKWVRSNTP